MKEQNYYIYRNALEDIRDFIEEKVELMLDSSDKESHEHEKACEVKGLVEAFDEWLECLEDERDTDAEFLASVLSSTQSKLDMANHTVGMLIEENRILIEKLEAYESTGI